MHLNGERTPILHSHETTESRDENYIPYIVIESGCISSGSSLTDFFFVKKLHKYKWIKSRVIQILTLPLHIVMKQL